MIRMAIINGIGQNNFGLILANSLNDCSLMLLIIPKKPSARPKFSRTESFNISEALFASAKQFQGFLACPIRHGSGQLFRLYSRGLNAGQGFPNNTTQHHRGGQQKQVYRVSWMRISLQAQLLLPPEISRI